jgi:hypothetical protein
MSPNLRITLECRDSRWHFTLHKDSQQHCGVRAYSTPEEALHEAQVLIGLLKLAKDRARRAGQPDVPTFREEIGDARDIAGLCGFPAINRLRSIERTDKREG